MKGGGRRKCVLVYNDATFWAMDSWPFNTWSGCFDVGFGVLTDGFRCSRERLGIALASGLIHCINTLALATLYHTSSLNDMHTPAYRFQYSGLEILKCFTREVSQLSLFVSFDSCKVSDVCTPLRLPQYDYELRILDSGQIHRKPAVNFLDEEMDRNFSETTQC